MLRAAEAPVLKDFPFGTLTTPTNNILPFPTMYRAARKRIDGSHLWITGTSMFKNGVNRF
jgi:hypothetical protein